MRRRQIRSRGAGKRPSSARKSRKLRENLCSKHVLDGSNQRPGGHQTGGGAGGNYCGKEGNRHRRFSRPGRARVGRERSSGRPGTCRSRYPTGCDRHSDAAGPRSPGRAGRADRSFRSRGNPFRSSPDSFGAFSSGGGSAGSGVRSVAREQRVGHALQDAVHAGGPGSAPGGRSSGCGDNRGNGTDGDRKRQRHGDLCDIRGYVDGRRRHELGAQQG